MIRNPNPGEGQHPGPEPRSKEGTRLPHGISVATVTGIPCSAENASEGRGVGTLQMERAPPAQLAFSGASLPEEAAQLYPPIKDFAAWHGTADGFCCVRMRIIICEITLIFHACRSLEPACCKLSLWCFWILLRIISCAVWGNHSVSSTVTLLFSPNLLTRKKKPC